MAFARWPKPEGAHAPCVHVLFYSWIFLWIYRNCLLLLITTLLFSDGQEMKSFTKMPGYQNF